MNIKHLFKTLCVAALFSPLLFAHYSSSASESANTVPTRTPEPTSQPITLTPTSPPAATATPIPTIPPPIPFSVSINNGALFTNDTEVSLSLSADTSFVEMQFSNDGGYPSGDWIPYNTSGTWTITTFKKATITRTVYVWFRNESGYAAGPFSDDIIYEPKGKK